MIGRRTLLAAGAALAARPAFAIDPGKASGRYNDEGVDFKVTHAIALAVDNAEGFLDYDKGLRVLLSDREVPVSAICGLAFPPVWGMAQAGKLEGLLLKIDLADRNALAPRASAIARGSGSAWRSAPHAWSANSRTTPVRVWSSSSAHPSSPTPSKPTSRGRRPQLPSP
jgi:hypothetical protein